MLSVNKKILCDVSYTDTIWLKRFELKTKKMFNWQISRKKKVLMEVMYELNEERSYKIKELDGKKESSLNQKIDFQNQNISIGW